MSDTPPPIERHEAADRFGKAALRAAHDLTAALAEAEGADAEPIVVRAGGPHRSLAGLAALLDEALAEDDPASTAPDTGHRDNSDGDDREADDREADDREADDREADNRDAAEGDAGGGDADEKIAAP